MNTLGYQRINKTSNILGYYFGYDEGFEYNGKSYTKDDERIMCSDGSSCTVFDANRDLIEYKYFKGVRLCTSVFHLIYTTLFLHQLLLLHPI